MSIRLDDLQNGYKIWQDPDLFCYGIDAVLLSHFAVMKPKDHVLDLGTGNGAIPLIMKACAPEGVTFTGLEIQKRAADLARKSTEYNHLGDSVYIADGDLKEAVSIFGAASFTLVTCNPPYMTEHHGLLNPEEPLAIARHEIRCSLRDVISQASRLLVTNGRFAMIHRPFRLAEIVRDLSEYGLEMKKMRLVYPYADREPTMVLLEAVKGGRPRVSVGPPLIIYEKRGVYTEEIRKIYG
jgi:tRNA1Val (adenine37-N6)-methyltransferase